mmetsp:Transcript_7096/g.23540  ORF Transcript_7096/g.23540 Transcript_7096/m.23540 type:complete len:348 (+) Transcript_7096:429-1472(+)
MLVARWRYREEDQPDLASRVYRRRLRRPARCGDAQPRAARPAGRPARRLHRVAVPIEHSACPLGRRSPHGRGCRPGSRRRWRLGSARLPAERLVLGRVCGSGGAEAPAAREGGRGTLPLYRQRRRDAGDTRRGGSDRGAHARAQGRLLLDALAGGLSDGLEQRRVRRVRGAARHVCEPASAGGHRAGRFGLPSPRRPVGVDHQQAVDGDSRAAVRGLAPAGVRAAEQAGGATQPGGGRSHRPAAAGGAQAGQPQHLGERVSGGRKQRPPDQRRGQDWLVVGGKVRVVLERRGEPGGVPPSDARAAGLPLRVLPRAGVGRLRLGAAPLLPAAAGLGAGRVAAAAAGAL